MGNRQTGHRYSFQDKFDIIESGLPKSGHYKLQSRENRQLYIGRQLTCNDQNEAFELQCIINEKYNNPSPFVTKLIRHENGLQQLYCSTDHKFYLLYRQIPKLLFDEINQRFAYNRPFLIQQIEAVINRVAKGLKYLYEIYHHHGAISTRAISWPTHSKQSIQLIDQWALTNTNRQQKHKIFRPKDQDDIDEKMLQRSHDLYSLGIVGRQMINVANGQAVLANQQGFSQLTTKIQILLSPQPIDRFLVYNLLTTHMPQNQILQTPRTIQIIPNPKVLHSAPVLYQSVKNPSFQQIQTNYTLLSPPLINNVKVNTHQVRVNPLNASVSANLIHPPRPESQLPSNKIITNYIPSNINNLPINTVSSLPPRNLSLSVSKNNLHNSINHNDNFNRNASTGKMNMTIPPLNLTHSSSNANINKINISIPPPTTSLRSSFIQNQPNIVPNAINTAQQNVPLVQFTQNPQQPLKRSLISFQTTQVPTQQNLSVSRNKSVVNFNSSLRSSFIQASSHISNVNTSNIPYTLPQPTHSLNLSQSIPNNTNNLQVNPVSSLNNISSSFNLTSNLNSIENPNLGGLSYSFGNSGNSGNSDQTFSFKGLQGSSGQQNLFTSPQFYAKVRQSSSVRQSQTLGNTQIKKPSINTISTQQSHYATTTLNPSQNLSLPYTEPNIYEKQLESPRVQEYTRNYKQIYNYVSIKFGRIAYQQGKYLEADRTTGEGQIEIMKQWNYSSTYSNYQSKVYSWTDTYTPSYTNMYTSKQKQYQRQKQKQKIDYFSTSIPKVTEKKRNIDETSAQFYQKIAIGRSNSGGKYDTYTPPVSTTYNYNKYVDYSTKYDTILDKLPSIPSYNKNNNVFTADLDVKDKKINKFDDNYELKYNVSKSASKDKDKDKDKEKEKFNEREKEIDKDFDYDKYNYSKNDYSYKYDKYDNNGKDAIDQILNKYQYTTKNYQTKPPAIQITAPKPKSPIASPKNPTTPATQAQIRIKIPAGATLLPTIQQHKMTTSFVRDDDNQQQYKPNAQAFMKNKTNNSNTNIVENIMKVSGNSNNSNISNGNVNNGNLNNSNRDKNSNISNGNSNSNKGSNISNKDSNKNSNISSINKNSNISNNSNKNSGISNNNPSPLPIIPTTVPNPSNEPSKNTSNIISNNEYNIKNSNNNIDNFNHIDQNKSYSVSPQSVKNASINSSPNSNKTSKSNIHEPIQQVQEQQDKISPQYTPNPQKIQDIKLIINQNNQNNMYKEVFNNYSQNTHTQTHKTNINGNIRQSSNSPTSSPADELEFQYNYTKNVDNIRTTPGKNTNSNQPFSTIPEVSERSMSMKSDQERDYVIEQYQNGSRYEGHKSNGMRNGKGKFYYQEGSFYDGQWKNNNMHGYGKLYYSNNKLAYEGEWFIDQFHGRGRVFNDQPAVINGFFDYTNFDNLDQKWKYYEGDLVCDSKQGDGKLVLSNEQFYQGQFKNDKVQGKGRFVTKNGQVINGVWEDSKLIMKL